MCLLQDAIEWLDMHHHSHSGHFGHTCQHCLPACIPAPTLSDPNSRQLTAPFMITNAAHATDSLYAKGGATGSSTGRVTWLEVTPVLPIQG